MPFTTQIMASLQKMVFVVDGMPTPRLVTELRTRCSRQWPTSPPKGVARMAARSPWPSLPQRQQQRDTGIAAHAYISWPVPFLFLCFAGRSLCLSGKARKQISHRPACAKEAMQLPCWHHPSRWSSLPTCPWMPFL